MIFMYLQVLMSWLVPVVLRFCFLQFLVELNHQNAIGLAPGNIAAAIQVGIYTQITQVHINLFITWFVITQFWIQHSSKMDPRRCIDYIEKWP